MADALKLQGTLGSDGEFDKRGIEEKDWDRWHGTIAEIDPATPEQIAAAKLGRVYFDRIGEWKVGALLKKAGLRLEIRLCPGDNRV